MDWNIVITVQPGSGHEHQLLGALARFGRFRPTAFHGVCMGKVDNIDAFLEALHLASEAGKSWFTHLGRAIPVEATFFFAPETLAERFKGAAAPLVDRMASGSFHVRLERRGLEGKIPSPAIEREVAEHLFDIAAGQKKVLRTDFQDPDYIVIAETLGEECGVGLLTRELRTRYPFVQPR